MHCELLDTSGFSYISIQPIYNNNDYDAFFLSINLLQPYDSINLINNPTFIGGTAAFYVTLLSG